MTKRRFWWIFLVVVVGVFLSWLLISTVAKHAEAWFRDPTTDKDFSCRYLAEMLAEPNRWKKIEGLRSWEEKLSRDDIKQLEKFANEKKHVDWALNYYAKLLLRYNAPNKYAVSSQVKKAENLFAKMRAGKISSGIYDKYIDEIAGLGNDIVPMLLDLLKYRNNHDFFRKDIAIKVLGELNDDRIVPALKSAIATEEHRNHLEQELLATLKHDSNDMMVDYVASVAGKQKSSFDQEYIISFLSRSELSNRVKMRLYSHYENFGKYGKHAVIRGLRKIDNGAAFGQLVEILRREKYGDAFRVAAYELHKLKNYDPSVVFLEVFKKAPDHACKSLIVPIAERDYFPAIPAIEERIAKAGNDVDGVRCRIWAAGALCRLGKDYDKNATIVREYLTKDYDPHNAGYAPYGVAGWLNDEETVNILISKITSKKPNKDMVKWTIKALGQIGDKKVLSVLREALTKVSLTEFRDIGEAIATIGHKNEDQEVVADGQSVQTVARHLKNLGGQQRALKAGSPEAKRRRHEQEQVMAWLKQHREVIPNIIEQSRSEWNHPLIVQLMKVAQIEMVAALGKGRYRPGEHIEIMLRFKNLGTETIYFQREGTPIAIFTIDGEEKRFLQSVSRRYKQSGVYKSLILPLKADETWTTTFQVHPKKEELSFGEYPMKVYYTVTDHYTLPEKGRFEGALVGTLVSNMFTVTIRI